MLGAGTFFKKLDKRKHLPTMKLLIASYEIVSVITQVCTESKFWMHENSRQTNLSFIIYSSNHSFKVRSNVRLYSRYVGDTDGGLAITNIKQIEIFLNQQI